jgi:hypothetical protein
MPPRMHAAAHACRFVKPFSELRLGGADGDGH